ncbi:hypothetical protein [Mucilaginibacter sp.]|uniref:hypothetical protein n=1 Tax=Mucilaginibacter sp. TaxID=1882438 RepID=UPI002605F6B7|nr:hypothetical protein [Mucilaginibacter sp.]MDB4922073.1 Tail length tape-measure protein [Mucilaginibacter sp.]
MPTGPVTDAYIDSVINANEPYNSSLNKTQGVQLRALVKLLRDSLEQEITDSAALRAPLDSPALTGSPTAPTQPATDNSTLLANTNFVKNAITAKFLTPGNGLKKVTTGSGPHALSYIELGGALFVATDIDAGTFYPFRVGNISGSAALISVDPANAQTQVIGGASQLNLQQSNVELLMATDNPRMFRSLLMNDAVMAVTDGVNNKGFEYAGNYEANFTARSLVTKQYADALKHKQVLALSSNSPTPGVNTDNYNVVHITGQTATITGFVMSGTPLDGDTLRITITGTASVPFTLGSSFEPSGGVPLSTTTHGTNRLDMGFVWNTETSKWRQIAVA